MSGSAGSSAASATSQDGAVIVGQSSDSGDSRAFRWTASTGIVDLGTLSGGSINASAANVSTDGSVVVGSSDSSDGIQAFRWTAGAGIEGLGSCLGLAHKVTQQLQQHQAKQ